MLLFVDAHGCASVCDYGVCCRLSVCIRFYFPDCVCVCVCVCVQNLPR